MQQQCGRQTNSCFGARNALQMNFMNIYNRKAKEKNFVGQSASLTSAEALETFGEKFIGQKQNFFFFEFIGN